ncbi:MAG: hypothetical protein Q9166_008138 [cf. Caloplaca sp. 2 TL-2023]
MSEQLKILTYGLDIIAFYAIKAGTGRHMITLTLDQITSFVKTDQATQVLFGCSITATKVSILFFYNRLFPFRTFYVVSLITGIASTLWWVGLMLTAFLHCRPLAYYWDRSIPNGYCVNDNLIGYSITSVNIVTDLIVLILPIPWLWGMNMAIPKRMAVVGLFVLGSFVCVAGIVRLPLLSEFKLSDATYTSISVGVWVNVECNIGILSACLPILRPLFSTKYASSPVSRLTRIFHTLTNSHFSSSSRDNLSSDPEKGPGPSSDATMAESLKWPNDSTAAGGCSWSRNNSYSTTEHLKPPIDAQSPIKPVGSRRVIAPGERARKQRTWYTAAADILPELDLQRRCSRKMINTEKIPRYRDDMKEQPRSPIAKVHGQVQLDHDKRWEKVETAVEQLPKWSRRSSHGLQVSIPSSGKQSHRSSLGRARDTWNLMPSVTLWERNSLVRAMNLR